MEFHARTCREEDDGLEALDSLPLLSLALFLRFRRTCLHLDQPSPQERGERDQAVAGLDLQELMRQSSGEVLLLRWLGLLLLVLLLRGRGGEPDSNGRGKKRISEGGQLGRKSGGDQHLSERERMRGWMKKKKEEDERGS